MRSETGASETDPPPAYISEDAIFGQFLAWEDRIDFNYDIMLRHPLTCPSLTAQWLPFVTPSDNKNLSIHRLILGTQSAIGDNKLMIGTIAIPNPVVSTPPPLDASAVPPPPFDPTVVVPSSALEPVAGPSSVLDANAGLSSAPPPYSEYLGGEYIGGDYGKFEIELKIDHEGDVIRARYMPQNPTLIATRSLFNDVLVYHYTKHQDDQGSNAYVGPELRLQGHKDAGKGISWNSKRTGHLLSSSDDHTVRLWDVSALPKKHRIINTSTVYTGHTSKVTDVAWHPKDRSVFGSVSDDKRAMIWDVRDRSTSSPSQTVEAHPAAANCISFNNFNENTFLTGGSDGTVAWWDLRHLNNTIERYSAHHGEVTHVGWNPNNETVFTSAGTDRKLFVWDLTREGEPVEGAKVKEVIYVHGGHMTNVADVAWNPNDPWIICSVAETYNILQVRQIYRHNISKQKLAQKMRSRTKIDILKQLYRRVKRCQLDLERVRRSSKQDVT